jgi:hypothetical protein
MPKIKGSSLLGKVDIVAGVGRRPNSLQGPGATANVGASLLGEPLPQSTAPQQQQRKWVRQRLPDPIIVQ